MTEELSAEDKEVAYVQMLDYFELEVNFANGKRKERIATLLSLKYSENLRAILAAGKASMCKRI